MFYWRGGWRRRYPWQNQELEAMVRSQGLQNKQTNKQYLSLCQQAVSQFGPGLRHATHNPGRLQALLSCCLHEGERGSCVRTCSLMQPPGRGEPQDKVQFSLVSSELCFIMFQKQSTLCILLKAATLEGDIWSPKK